MSATCKSILKTASTLALAVVVPVSFASAAQDPAGWVGGLFGLSIPNADNTTARPIYGITGGAKLGSEWGLGAYYLNSQKDEENQGVSQKFNFDLYGVEFAYHFEGEARGVYLGGRLGTSKLAFGVGPNSSISTSPFHWGAVAGYNHFLGEHFSLGGDLSFMSVSESSASATAGAASTSIPSFTMLNFMASAKLWF